LLELLGHACELEVSLLALLIEALLALLEDDTTTASRCRVFIRSKSVAHEPELLSNMNTVV